MATVGSPAAMSAPNPGAAPLGLAEANELGAALLARASALSSIRILVIKGISLQHHRLRVGHVSSDVDVLVEPGCTQTLSSLAIRSGWRVRQGAAGDSRMTRHSITLSNAGWPSDLDLHSEFPGLLAGDARAFETLWANRDVIAVAGQPVCIPDRASSLVIWALHSLRGTATQHRHAQELERIVEAVLPKLSDSDREELAGRIVELGADEPLRTVPEFAEIIGDRRGSQAPGALQAWEAKVTQAHDVTPWLQVLREARPSDWTWLILRAAWPSARDLRLTDERLVDTPLGRVQSRGRRAWRLVRRIAARRRQAH